MSRILCCLPHLKNTGWTSSWTHVRPHLTYNIPNPGEIRFTGPISTCWLQVDKSITSHPSTLGPTVTHLMPFPITGVFRDLFVNQMLLLDRAVKLAAELDEPEEMNFVRKHAREQAEEMGCNIRDAATRIFSNASGSYSSNVNLAVENSSWSDEAQLQEMYMKRKSFAFNSDRCG